MNINKKQYSIFIFVAFIVAVALAYFIFFKSKAEAPVITGEHAVFSLQDNSDIVAWHENTNVDETSRTEFNKRINDLQQKIDNETNVDALLDHYVNISLYYKYLGDYQNAYEYALKALEIDSNFRRSWLNLGDILVKMKAYNSAELAYKKSIELFNYDDIGWKKLIALYNIKEPDNYDLIKSTYEDALAILRNNSEDEMPLLKQYAQWLDDSGKSREARDIYDELIEKDGANAAIYRQAKNNL